MIFVGVDPGANGAIAYAVEAVDGSLEVVRCIKIPQSDSEISRVLHGVCGCGPGPVVVHLEKVWANPHDTPVTAAGLVGSYRALRMALSCIQGDIEIREVAALRWRRVIGAGSGVTKHGLHGIARQSFVNGDQIPLYAADAALLVRFGKLTYGGDGHEAKEKAGSIIAQGGASVASDLLNATGRRKKARRKGRGSPSSDRRRKVSGSDTSNQEARKARRRVARVRR